MTDDKANPKHSQGMQKVPMHLWPAAATAYGAMGLLEGALKYGRNNWRATDVYASIYIAAAMRHMAAWAEGEEISDEGVPHLSNALACLAIIVDAKTQGSLIDDRNYVANHHAWAELMKDMGEVQHRLTERFGHVKPKDYDRRDNKTGWANAPMAKDVGHMEASLTGDVEKDHASASQRWYGDAAAADSNTQREEMSPFKGGFEKILSDMGFHAEKMGVPTGQIVTSNDGTEIPPEIVETIRQLQAMGIVMKEITMYDTETRKTKTFKVI